MAKPPFPWQCPFCQRNATITTSNFHDGGTGFFHGNAHGLRYVYLQAIICPNPECLEFTLQAELREGAAGQAGYIYSGSQVFRQWSLIPESESKPMPSYIPQPLISDYVEACLVRDLSPKASATLARRCLQGMIRDFFGVKKGRLVDEIEAIRGSVDASTWSAIDAVRKIGNIGAHMEKDINVIVEVDPGEAKLLINLIEMLFVEWYVARYEREERLRKLVEIAGEKDSARKPAVPGS
jgi:hypothetical protein